MSAITTTNNLRFPSQDITFRGARKQSDMYAELPVASSGSPADASVPPVSCTPESVVSYFEAKSKSVPDAEKRVYEAAIAIMRERNELKRLNASLASRLAKYEKGDESGES